MIRTILNIVYLLTCIILGIFSFILTKNLINTITLLLLIWGVITIIVILIIDHLKL